MVKINFTNARHKRRKKILKLAKGYFGSKSTIYKTANEQVMRSLQYSYIGRKQRKRQFRRLWITRINAGCLNNGISYSKFIHGLSLSKVKINRKMLSDLVYNKSLLFDEYINLSKKNLEKYKDKNSNEILSTSDEVKNFSNSDKKKIDLKKFLLVDLRKLALKYNIKNYSKLKKTELINVLQQNIK
ncbi:50S ribosomal protein L20 [Texas Phoenix palm phytoplasma]|uniref:Large ribosomal subunit protein bL20 n=1 Tax=Texas Phoenix palm phytoplasma TaxID=176709 RepID=A0ABS5BIQ5_9MOLU|nr:50S ribosomal protein L20 [Texas Phoenix palm phytoplasma]